MEIRSKERTFFIASELRQHPSVSSREAAFFVTLGRRSDPFWLLFVDIARSPYGPEDMLLSDYLCGFQVDWYIILVGISASVGKIIGVVVTVKIAVARDPLEVQCCILLSGNLFDLLPDIVF